MTPPSTGEIWLLGASGRAGRAIAAELGRQRARLVLVGRDRAALDAVAATMQVEARVVVADKIDAIAARLRAARPAVVVNTLGPFASTACAIIDACASGAHYVDLSNELAVTRSLLARHREAQAAGRTIVTGAGFGVLASESVVRKLCMTHGPATRVRVDSVAYVDQTGVVGPTLAATVVGSLPMGGRCYRGGVLRRAGLGSHPRRLTLPDGSTATCGLAALGELEAARRASGAGDVIAASAEVPTTLSVRILVPLLIPLLRIAAVRNLAERRIAAIALAPSGRVTSWAHAEVVWSDGSTRNGWLRAGEAYDFLGKACSEVALRLARDEGRPGAFTPGALFGHELAQVAGGEFIDC